MCLCVYWKIVLSQIRCALSAMVWKSACCAQDSIVPSCRPSLREGHRKVNAGLDIWNSTSGRTLPALLASSTEPLKSEICEYQTTRFVGGVKLVNLDCRQ
ncbi:hypothetical protein BC830DRAFT_1118590 [Chytriomyces sp. MP71]|nr:hypothetical protein BC830DRAFT_1118590 [Chytriomyces sp. MP71]